MFLKNKNIISKMKRSKVTDYAALRLLGAVIIQLLNVKMPTCLIELSMKKLYNLEATKISHIMLLAERGCPLFIFLFKVQTWDNF